MNNSLAEYYKKIKDQKSKEETVKPVFFNPNLSDIKSKILNSLNEENKELENIIEAFIDTFFKSMNNIKDLNITLLKERIEEMKKDLNTLIFQYYVSEAFLLGKDYGNNPHYKTEKYNKLVTELQETIDTFYSAIVLTSIYSTLIYMKENNK